MSAQNDSGKDNDARGFAGLSSLLSSSDALEKSIRTPVRDAASPKDSSKPAWTEDSPPADVVTAPHSLASTSKPPDPTTAEGSQGNEDKGGFQASLWLIPVGIVLAVLLVRSIRPEATPLPDQPQAYVDTTPAQPSVEIPSPAPSVNADSIFGTQPQVGTNLVLDESQIRYCVAQRIRLEGAQDLAVLDTDARVSLFNALVADYNSRCSEYQYRPGAQEAAVAAVEPHRRSLRLEGLRFISDLGEDAPDERVPLHESGATATGSSDTPGSSGTKGFFQGVDTSQGKGFLEQAGASNQKAQNARLDELDEACEAVNASDGEEAYNACLAQNRSADAPKRSSAAATDGITGIEKSSIESACSADKNLHGPAAYRACVQRQLEALARAPRRPDLSRLSSVERQSMESACSADKHLHGPAAYNTCLQRELEAWTRAPRRPDLSSLSSVERQSMESVCSADKHLHGPAAYNTCLQRELEAWTRAPRRPDLSSLSAVERQSMESACSVDKSLHGPAAYNTCLSQQLQRL